MRDRSEILIKYYHARARKTRNLKKGDDAGYRTACALEKFIKWVLADELPKKKKCQNYKK